MKKIKFKVLVFIVFLTVSFSITFSLLDRVNLELGNNNFYHYLIKSSSSIKADALNDYYDFKGIYQNLVKLEGSKFIYDEVSLKSVKVNSEAPVAKVNKEPLVYIYNSHQTEEYSAKSLENYNIKPNVMMASYILKENLDKAGINSLVEENSVKDILNTNNWKYNKSYKVTKMFMESAKKNHSSLKYFIDLHRDSVKRSITTTTIKGEKYAKIMILVGLDHDKYKDNLKEAEIIDSMLKEEYPTISRGIYKKSGKGVNGIYNQDFSKYTFLFEIGGSDNDIVEVNNSVVALSKILIKYIGEQNEKI